LAIADQCLHSIKAFPVSHSVPTASSVGMGKRLGGHTVETAEPSWLKEQPIPHAIVLSNIDWELIFAERLPGKGSERLIMHHLQWVFCVFSPFPFTY